MAPFIFGKVEHSQFLLFSFHDDPVKIVSMRCFAISVRVTKWITGPAVDLIRPPILITLDVNHAMRYHILYDQIIPVR